mmetsp:Transcript_27260/g.91206  ORF Transcript_27260/g.91206 Transcript_27260/m.91206 type:complete len:272 (-) Transcript_27260:533-1348(-)
MTRSWRWMALRYFSLRSLDVAASQDQRSASARAALPMRARRAGSSTSCFTLEVKSEAPSSPGRARKPVSPDWMRSGTPPASTPTGATPEAMDSSTTNPSVSESLGSTNTSAEAKASESSAPFMRPRNRTRPCATRSPNTSDSRRGREGPPPTMARCTSGRASRVPLSCWMRLDSQTRPTYSSSGRSLPVTASTPPRRSRMAADLYAGSNLMQSTPLGHTSTCFTPCSVSSAASWGLVVSVRSAWLWTHFINTQLSFSQMRSTFTGRRYSRA